jgi:hypothetical protein
MSDTTTTVIETPDATVPEPRPRIRVGAIVWGVLVTAIAASALYIRADISRSTEFATWLGGLTPVSIGLLAILAVGLFVLIVALLSVVKRAQTRGGHPPVG